MDWLVGIDWEAALKPQAPLLEIVFRGTLTYLFVFAIFRIVLKRQAGTLGITDLIVVVFVADASQNAMANDYTSITDGVLLVAVIVFWAFALDWAAYRFRSIERVIRPSPLLLVEDGRMFARNMKKELLSPDELMSHLRLSGIGDLSEVERAQMESNGQISVVRKDREETTPAERTAK